MKSVEKFPEYQGNAQNIQLLSRPEHAETHNGNFQNSTNGFYNYVTKQTIGFGENEFKPCEIVYLSEPIFPPNVSSESKYISELEDNGKDSASENNNADNAQKANLKQEKMQPSKTPVSVSKPKRGFSDRIMGVVEKVNDFQYKHPIISEVAKIVVPLAVGAGVDHLAGGGKRKSRSISSKPSVSRTSSVKNTGPSVEKVVNAATKVAETIKKVRLLSILCRDTDKDTMACGRIKRHIKGVENKTTGGDCLSEFEYNEVKRNEFTLASMHFPAFVPARNVEMYIVELHGITGGRKVWYGVVAPEWSMVREYVMLLPFQRRLCR